METTKKLIKISENQFVIGSSELIEIGDFGVVFAHGHRGIGSKWFIFKHDNSPVAKINSLCDIVFKVTHSTAVSVLDEEEQESVIKINLSDVKKLVGEVDAELLSGVQPHHVWNVEFNEQGKLQLAEKYGNG